MSQWKLHILQDPAFCGFCHFHLRSLYFVHVGIIAGRKVKFTSGGMICFVLIISFHLSLNCMGLYPHNTSEWCDDNIKFTVHMFVHKLLVIHS